MWSQGYSLMTPDIESNNTVYFLFIYLSHLQANVIEDFPFLPDSVSVTPSLCDPSDSSTQHSVWFIVNTEQSWSPSHITPPSQGDMLEGKGGDFTHFLVLITLTKIYTYEECVCVYVCVLKNEQT